MKLISRLFNAQPPAPAPDPVVEPPAAPPEPAPPALDPAEQENTLRAIESGRLEPDELMRLAVEGATTRLRQAAAAAIHDPQAWQALLPQLRGRDKAAYKLIKQRHDARLAQQREQARANSDAAELCTALETLAAKPYNVLFEPTLSALTARWRALPPDTDSAMRQRAEQALARAQEVVAAHERELARIAESRAAEAARARAMEAEQRAQQQAAEEKALLEARAQAEAEEARQAEALAEAQAQREQQAADAEVHARILSLIRLGGAAIGRGDTRKAARFRQSLEAALAGAPGLPPHLARNLEQFDARLNQLRQWKEYAAAPKRIELIEEVEALIGAEEAPEALLEHLRALRQEWRTLNKGLAVESPEEAARFEQAYTAAFQPCQAWLNEQAAIRRANLEARRQVLERVRAFEAGIDADNPDHPLIARVLREAPQQWRTHSPVDRDAGRGLDAEFFGALDRLRARLNAWYTGNLGEKQALIERARQLTTLADLSRAIEEAKRLQVQWKGTGPVPHAQSQALWDEFRSLCNQVFERRQQELAAQDAALGRTRAAAEELCAQIEQACLQGPADRPGGEARLREWQASFTALGELPHKDARNLRTRYQRAMSSYESQIAGLARRDAEAIENHVLVAAQHVRAFQRAVIHGDARRDELKAAAEAFIAGVPRWPGKGVLQALRQALARADSAQFVAADDDTRERTLRSLCIRAEILSGTATPAEDVPLRREQELQLLRQGLGQARHADERTWEALRIEWLGQDATEPALHDALEARFLRCLRPRAPAA